ncbi:16S rRNA (guanine(527)-N(7))-methyltransferase RsmG [Lentisphaerota bacterium ZTH]|nr:16S rRNA (guanine(527)-N(7))-methyltransferase RsmG [Lentisphaerota bacterium]WET07653.1 16S rRNA (guanine(527)-N(7))-methyltransferase RsmG [Lentisphaerota bacterium ZTH]
MIRDFSREEFKNFCLSCGVSDFDFFINRCDNLYELLLAANAKVNLTRIQDKDDFMIKHVADSLAICRYFPEIGTGLRIVDIGCGAGFPSLILATAFPQLQITAVDSISKKTAFVESAGASLGLSNLKVFTGRSREMNRREEWQERFDILTARAVSDLRTLYREARNMLKSTGRFVFFKTPEQAAAELDNLKKISSRHNISWRVTEVFDLPAAGGKRVFVYSDR